MDNDYDCDISIIGSIRPTTSNNPMDNNKMNRTVTNFKVSKMYVNEGEEPPSKSTLYAKGQLPPINNLS